MPCCGTTKQPIDDYDLYDLDFEEWQRRGLEAFGIEVKEKESEAA